MDRAAWQATIQEGAKELDTETKDLYIENYKTLVKEIKRTLTDGEIYHVHGLEESI